MALKMQLKPLTIGICGGSGAGKTTLADELCGRFHDERILRLPHDAYYRDQDHLSPDRKKEINFDHPDSLDTADLIRDLEALFRGESVVIPVYDFSQHRRTGGMTVKPAPVILLEGILILENPRLRKLLDIKVFVNVDEDIRLSRRLARDIRERGRDLESVLAQYSSTVRPMHRRFVQPSSEFADLVVRDGRNRVVVDVLAARIEKHLRETPFSGDERDE